MLVFIVFILLLSHLDCRIFTVQIIFPQKLYKQKFEKEKGKSEYNNMTVPPDVKHAMDVAKNQSNVSLFGLKR